MGYSFVSAKPAPQPCVRLYGVGNSRTTLSHYTISLGNSKNYYHLFHYAGLHPAEDNGSVGPSWL